MSDPANMTEEERMAAEWEAGAGAGGDDMAALMGGDTARVLNQDEIDSLLGFGDADSNSASGITAIINSALVNYERLPMLEIVFDRLVRDLSTSLRNFTSDNVEVSLDQMTAVRFGDYLNSIPLPAMITIFKAEEWDNYGLMTVDSSMIYSIVIGYSFFGEVPEVVVLLGALLVVLAGLFVLYRERKLHIDRTRELEAETPTSAAL